MENALRGSLGRDALPRGTDDLFPFGTEPPMGTYDRVPSNGTRFADTATDTGNQRFTVLLAEDNEDLRKVMGLILARMGYVVVSCPDAQLASEAFRSRSDIGLLLTDLEMPGRSGVELARELTALRPSLAVMIVSGSVIPDNLSREMRTRNWSFLSKPFDIAALLENLHFLLRSGHEQAA